MVAVPPQVYFETSKRIQGLNNVLITARTPRMVF